MNRQAVPSILLSVAIVCFFAVALYERDPHPRPASSRGSTGKGAPLPIGSSTPTATQAARVTPASVARSEANPHPRSIPGRLPETTPDAAKAMVHEANDRAAREGGLGPHADTPAPAIRLTSNRSGGQVSDPPTAAGSSRVAGASREADARPSRGSFTVVGSNETIADVARRVYGTSSDAGSLWRANRDVLAGPDSPLAPGTKLRTPARWQR